MIPFNSNYSLIDRLAAFFRQRTSLPTLILINIGVWLGITLVSVFLYLYNVRGEQANDLILTWLAMPADVNMLMLRWWTPMTYMFTHTGLFHILFNMLWLYWFGMIFLEFLSSRQLTIVYILGGLGGGLLYLFVYNYFPVFEGSIPLSILLGASASVMAIVTTISLYVPNYSINLLFIGRIRIYYMAIFLFILDFMMISGSNAGGHIAHIGGAITGGLFYLFIKYKSNMGMLFKKKYKPKFKIHYNHDDTSYNAEKKMKEADIDKILDKISKSGYQSLTKEEKDFMFRNSK